MPSSNKNDELTEIEEEETGERELEQLLLDKWKAGELEVDFGGHFGFDAGPIKPGDPKLKRFWDEDRFMRQKLGEEHMVSFKLVILCDEKGIEIDQMDLVTDLKATLKKIGYSKDHLELTSGSGSDACSECGEGVKIIWDGEKVSAVEPCVNAGGLGAWDLELDIPSGKMVFGNDFRELFPTEESFYINHAIGVKKCEEDYAKKGMFHFFVGNTCPSVFQKGNSIIIGNFSDEKDDLAPEEYTNVDSVCTDLWWVSIADYDEYINRGGKINEKYNDVFIVEVEPGRYKLKSMYHDQDDSGAYATIEKM